MPDETRNNRDGVTYDDAITQAQTEFSRTLAKSLAVRWINHAHGNGPRTTQPAPPD